MRGEILKKIGRFFSVVALLAASLAIAPQPASALTGACRDTLTSTMLLRSCFNDPTSTDSVKQNVITNEIYKKITEAKNAAPTKPVNIHMAMFNWEMDSIASNLLDAHKAGANVSIIVDEKTGGNPLKDTKATSSWNILTSHNDAHGTHKMKLQVCYEACITGAHSTAKMHNKFFLFEIGGVKTVIQTSSNLNGAMQSGYWNNSLTVTGRTTSSDSTVYDWYKQYWARMWENNWTGFTGGTWGDGATGGKEAATNVDGTFMRTFAFPRGWGDPVAEALANVKQCSSTNNKVWVATSTWHNRPAVLSELLRLQKICDVKVLVNSLTDAQELVSGGVAKSRVRYTKDADKLHEKTIVVDADFGGVWRKLAFTGSHNLSANALSVNDEAMIRVGDAGTFGAFRDRFSHMFSTTYSNVMP